MATISPTNDQIAAVLLQHGTPEQQKEALDYALQYTPEQQKVQDATTQRVYHGTVERKGPTIKVSCFGCVFLHSREWHYNDRHGNHYFCNHPNSVEPLYIGTNACTPNYCAELTLIQRKCIVEQQSTTPP